MADKCPDCGRKKAATGHEWNIGFQSARGDEVADTCGAHLSSYWFDDSGPDCKEATMRNLRSQLRASEAGLAHLNRQCDEYLSQLRASEVECERLRREVVDLGRDKEALKLRVDAGARALLAAEGELRALMAVVEQAKTLRRAVGVHQHAYSCTPAFDDAIAELEKTKNA